MNIKKLLKDDLVYWPSEGASGPGNEVYGPPEEMKCRWEDKNEVYMTRSGEEKVSKSVVFTERDVAADGILFLGKMEDLVDLDVPLNNPGAGIIQRFDKIPGRKGMKQTKKIVRMAYL